jgi:putative ABC transport system permease protein
MMRRRLRGLRDIFLRRRADEALDAELSFHIDMQTAQYVRAGHSPAEARRLALVDFGGVERHREATLAVRRVRPVEDLLRDVRQGARSLARAPVFALLAIISLGLGTGAATAVFTIADGVLLKPLAYGNADRLYTLYEGHPSGGIRNPSYPTFEDWRSGLTAFDAIAYIRGDEFRLRGEEGTQRLLAGYVTEDFFAVTATLPQLGRTFADGASDDPNVVVLSHHVWERRFGRDPGVLGATLSTVEGTFTVVGVMPRGFRLPGWADVWVPLAALPASQSHVLSRRDLNVDAETWGLVRAGVSAADAQRDLARVVTHLAQEYPDIAGEFRGARLTSAREREVGESAGQIRIIAAAVLLLLFIVCVNVAGLQLARGGARARELAVRATLGAGRGRIIRQLLTESLLIAVTGGALGVVFAATAVSAFTAAMPDALPRLAGVAVDARALVFALTASVASTLLFGLMPALRDSRSALYAVLRQGGAGSISGGTRLRSGLVVAQIALAMVLTVGSGLLVRSLWKLQQRDAGFDTADLVALRVFPPPHYADVDAAATLYRELLEAVQRVPGVNAAALTNHASLVGGWMVTRVLTGGEPPATGSNALIRTVSPEYFDVTRVRRQSGRLLDASDFAAVGSGIVINDALARQFFGADDAVGRSVTIFHSSQDRPNFGEPIQATIVGVVEGEHAFGLEQDPPPMVYLPYTWMVWGNITLLARTGVPAHTLLPALRNAVQHVERDIPVAGPAPNVEWRPVSDFLALSLERRRLMAVLLSGFAGSALLLALLGVFGLTAYVVARRTREIGVRMAIGAPRRAVGWLILAQALRLAAVGVLLGVPATLLAGRLLASELFGIAASDPLTIAAAASAFVLATLAAAVLPAVRALRIPPTVALRSE